MSASIWTAIAAQIDADKIAWRQDGKAVARKTGGFVARFVPYIEANTVRERLDAVVSGQWTTTLTPLPDAHDKDGTAIFAFRCTLTIMDPDAYVSRDDVGTGETYKEAATDAFKRAATRFGIAHELYDYEQNWVEVDSDSKYAKPVVDPGVAYARRNAGGSVPMPAPGKVADAVKPIAKPAPPPPSNGAVVCPSCGGGVWDNRASKTKPTQPDYKCKNAPKAKGGEGCPGVIWPPKAGVTPPTMREPGEEMSDEEMDEIAARR